MQSGIGLVKGMQSFTSIDTLAPDATYGPVGEIRLVPDPDTFVVLPYAPRSGQMLVNMVELDHSPWALDPRSFLQRMVARAAGAGLAFDAAFENEFYLAVRTEDGFRPVDRSLCFSAIGMDSTEEVIQDIIAALTDQGLTVELSHPELGWGQQELSIAPRPGAAGGGQPDHLPPDGPWRRGAARARRVARTEALRRPGRQRRPPPLEHLGHGSHGRTGWRTPAAKDGLSPLARHAIAGVLAHLPGLLGLTTPERQLVPPPAAPLLELRLHGLGHREPRGRGPGPDAATGTTRRARRTSSSRRATPSANPYISLGGVIAAALDGIERGLDPGEPVNEDPGNLTEAERARRGIRRFPETARRGARRAREGRSPDGRARRAARRRSTSRSAGPRRRRTPSRTRPTSSSSTSSSTDRRRPDAPRSRRRSRSSTTTAIRCCATSRPDDEAFRIHLTETYFPEVARDDVPHSLFYHWTIRELAGLLDCEPTPDAVHAARRERGLSG